MSDYQPQSLLAKTLKERGFFHQCTDLPALDQSLQSKPIAAYIGFDATGDCLHVGSLVQIMMLRWLCFGHVSITWAVVQPALVIPLIKIRNVLC